MNKININTLILGLGLAVVGCGRLDNRLPDYSYNGRLGNKHITTSEKIVKEGLVYTRKVEDSLGYTVIYKDITAFKSGDTAQFKFDGIDKLIIIGPNNSLEHDDRLVYTSKTPLGKEVIKKWQPVFDKTSEEIYAKKLEKVNSILLYHQ